MRTIACESRAYVLSANQCQQRRHLPLWITGSPPSDSAPTKRFVPKPSTGRKEELDEYVSRGGSCIISPTGEVLEGPLWETEQDGEILSRVVDFEDCERGRLDLDVAGSYGRGDVFRLEVQGLDISPPP